MCARWFLTGLLICLFLSTDTKAQQYYAYAVSFRDKQGSTGSLSNVSAFLSPRAISRRYEQGIAVDTTDLPVSAVYVDSALSITNGILHETSKWLNLCVIVVAASDTSKISILQSKPYVTDIKYVANYATYHPKSNPQIINNNASFKTTWSAAYYGVTYPQVSFVQGDCLHNLGYMGQGKLIAVLDAGFSGTNTHPGFDSLFLNNQIVDWHNFTLNSNSVYNYDSHGTSCLSTMAGNWPDTFVGNAPNAQYALYVTEDGNSEQPVELYNLVAGTERADSVGADIISCSLGYDTFDPPFGVNYFNFSTDFDGKTTVAARGVNFATKKGILFVTSAGNDATFSQWPHILTPSDADSALTVGAVQFNAAPYAASGPGPNASGQVKPDICDVGVSVDVFNQNGGIATEDGTSFSTPQIAGLAACLWQAAGNVSPHAIRAAIDSTGDHHTNPGNQLGYGIPNFCQALQILDVKDTPKNPMGTDWIRLGPNPMSGNTIELHVYLTSGQTVSFRLLDISGREVLSKQISLNSGYNAPVYLPVNGYLPSGMYILKASTATRQQVIKVERL